MALTLPLLPPVPSLQVAGGKGRSLVHLIEAGFEVPRGFFVTTEAYRLHAGAVGVGSAEHSDNAVLIVSSEMPGDVREAIVGAYRDAGEPAVAVRSSATAEDLP